MADSSFFCSLSHESVLAVRGPDASALLQGQLTCNLNYLSDTHASLGARCTPKGRMLSSFRILREADGYLLAMASELLDAQLSELKKYAAFSKSTLSDASTAWVRWGLVDGEAALLELGLAVPEAVGAVARANGMLAVRSAAHCVELWVTADAAARVRARLAERLAEAPLNSWLLAQVRAGIGQVYGPTRELFIPQMLNLQALDGVSFKKGCYTGQEIVARMQYLGKLKRRLYHLAFDSLQLPAAATELFSPLHASSIGEVVLAATADNSAENGPGNGPAITIELLAVVQADAVADGRIHLGAPDGPLLRLLELPYGLDRERELER
ncbi:MAG: YgfZ/GcvT domain-containing protein [Pseudomonas sp.]